MLVIPKEHYRNLIDLPDEVCAHIALVLKRMSSAVREVMKADAISHVTGDDLTGMGLNLVDHFKSHVIPRRNDDRVEINWNRDDDPRVEARARVAAAVRDAFSKHGWRTSA